MEPFISFIVCSYNSPELLLKCIKSIFKQKYSGKKEIIIVDGGSDNKTLHVLRELKKKHKEIIILNNPKRLPEGYGMGKWLGWKKAKGEYVFIIDQDNELQGENCIKEMLIPFKNSFKEKNIFGCVCNVKVDHGDSLTNQYVSLTGTDPFFAYRSLGGFINPKKIGEDNRDYIIIKINPNNLLITGGNCFVYKKDILDRLGGYVQDIENVMKLVNYGHDCVAISKNASTHHSATKGFFDFIRKKNKWAGVYKKIEKRGTSFSYIPSTKIERKEMLINIFFIITVIPNIFLSMKKIIETKERAWILHPLLSFITGVIYFYYFIFKYNFSEN
ncbi:MAG: glycosyltransferase family 2 protein [Nanoarchaeota archaeon]